MYTNTTVFAIAIVVIECRIANDVIAIMAYKVFHIKYWRRNNCSNRIPGKENI